MAWLPFELTANLVYILLVLGVWMVSVAIITPGTGVYEFLALLLLAAAGAGLALLPVNLWSLALVLAGLVCFAAAVLSRRASYWLVGAAVLISAGSVFLFRLDTGGLAVHPAVALLATGSTVWFYWYVIRRVLKSQQSAAALDPDRLINRVAQVRTDLDPLGTIHIEGELWTARSDEAPIGAGEKVEIIGRNGLILLVRSLNV